MERIAYERIVKILSAFEVIVDKAIADLEDIEAEDRSQREFKAAA